MTRFLFGTQEGKQCFVTSGGSPQDVVSPTPSDQSAFTSGIEVAKNICEILAILVGGAWTYLNYFRGRTYRPRLECAIDAATKKHRGHSFMEVVITVKNVGLSKIGIQQRGTALLVYSALPRDSSPSSPVRMRWSDKPAAFEVFTNHKWIESSETIGDSILIILPHDGAVVYKATLKLVSGKIWWTADRIVEGS